MLFIPFIILALVLVVWYKQWEKSFYQKPPNYPEPSQRNGKPLFVGFGDSLTQGNIGANWLNVLAAQRPDIQFFNAGMNADLSYTLLTRIDDVIDCQPQYISLFVGCNDVNATMAPVRMQRYYELGKITQDANYEGFKENYKTILQRLSTETTAKILLISIAPITEHPQHAVNQKAELYNQVVKELAQEFGLIYIPFREQLWQQLPKAPSQIADYEVGFPLIRKAIIKHYLFQHSWNQISQRRHAQFLIDNIHLNNTAADILVQLIAPHIH
jgi:lysophospholipase L1-like esterase